MTKNELMFHVLVILLVVLLCFVFLIKRSVNFDRNYPNPIPLTGTSTVVPASGVN